MPGRQDHDALTARARVALTNARLPELAPLLADYGLDDAALDEGDALLTSAETASRSHAQEYGEQYAATDRRDALEAEARALYARLVRLARIAYAPGTEGHTRLTLGGTRADAAEAFLREARTFYDLLAADAALRAPLERRRITPAALTAALASLDALDAAIATQTQESGEAQEATDARNTAHARLRGWMRDFTATAEIALDAHPQMRERLGLLER